jgi:predicted ATPase
MAIHEAVRLFCERMSATGVRDPPDELVVSRLVELLDCLPLAIELAAARTSVLPPAQQLYRIGERFRLLAARTGRANRHATLRATIDWSWHLLTSAEQLALAQLSVFEGGFDLAAAEAVLELSRESAEAWIPDVLGALMQKSLLRRVSATRYDMLRSIHDYASERLNTFAGATERRHAEHFHRVLAAATPATDAAEQAALDAIAVDLENCRKAWRWAVANHATDAIASSAPALKQFFNVRGRVVEGLALLEEARAACDASAASAAVLLAAIAQTQYRLSRLDDAAVNARLGIQRAREGAHPAALVRCLSVLGTCCWQWGRHEEARRWLDEATRRALADADARGAALAQHNLALVEKALGNHERAAQLMREWLVGQRQAGDWLRVAMGLSNLAYVYQAQGDWSLAQSCLEEGLAICDAHELVMPRPALLANLAHNHAAAGRLDEAERVADALLDDARAKQLSDVEATALNQQVRIALLRGDLASARTRLRASSACAMATGIEYVQLDCVLSYARLLAGEGRADAAAPLLRFVLARTDVEPVDRADAEACLARLGSTAVAQATPPAVAVRDLVQRVAAEVAAAA